MQIEQFLAKWNAVEGRTRIISDSGNILHESYDPYGGLSVDYVSAELAINKGHKFNKEKYDPDTFRFFKR